VSHTTSPVDPHNLPKTGPSDPNLQAGCANLPGTLCGCAPPSLPGAVWCGLAEELAAAVGGAAAGGIFVETLREMQAFDDEFGGAGECCG
jgi:hypothetical protein